MQKASLYKVFIVINAVFQLTSCLGQSQTTRSQFRLLTYGMPDFEKQNAERVIADKWGIEFYSVAGCVITQKLEDSVEQHNKAVEISIANKFGKDWRNKFHEEVDAEFERETKITALIDRLDYVRKKRAEMEKEGNGLHYIMAPIVNTTKYNVYAQGWGTWNGQDEWVTYYKFVADYKTRSIKLLSDKVVKD